MHENKNLQSIIQIDIFISFTYLTDGLMCMANVYYLMIVNDIMIVYSFHFGKYYLTKLNCLVIIY